MASFELYNKKKLQDELSKTDTFDSMSSFNSAGGAAVLGDGTYNIGGSLYTIKNSLLKRAGMERLTATGNDQSAEITQFLNDTGSSGILDVGDFIIGSDIVVYSNRTDTVTSAGTGFNFQGQGPSKTRLLDVRSNKTNNLLTLAGHAQGARNYLFNIAGMSFYNAGTNGTILSGMANLAGKSAIAIEATVGSGYGATNSFLGKIENVTISGFVNGIILDDVSGLDMNQVLVNYAQRGVWSGGNNDFIMISNCGFGVEGGTQTGMVGIECSYVGRVGSAGSGNCWNIKNTWFMGLDNGVWFNGAGEDTITFDGAYFERCKQYFVSGDGVRATVKMTNCEYSLTTTNDSTAAKIKLGNQVNQILTLEHCHGGGAILGGWIEVTGQQARVSLLNSRIAEPATGILISNIAGQSKRLVKINDLSGNTPNIVFGGQNCCQKLTGEDRLTQVSNQVGPFTYTIDYINQDIFYVYNWTGAITIAMDTTTLPTARMGTTLTFRFLVGATAQNNTIVWPASTVIKFPFTFAQPSIGDDYKVSEVTIRRMGSGWKVISGQNDWT